MKHCMWIHPNPEDDEETWRRSFGQMREAGVDGAVMLVADGSRALYESRHLPSAGPVLERLAPCAAREGVELHAWIVALRCNVEQVLDDHPDWYSVSRVVEDGLKGRADAGRGRVGIKHGTPVAPWPARRPRAGEQGPAP